jgi:hypothetical protein
MKTARARLAREEATIAAMIALRCRCLHPKPEGGTARQGPGLCSECAALLDYARKRLSACPWGAEKPTCAACPRHCYRQAERALIKRVMAWSGPRMLLRHPFLALAHLADGFASRRSLHGLIGSRSKPG